LRFSAYWCALILFARYRHAADKLQKTENVMEKYKKKLQEGADLRQQLKVCLAFWWRSFLT
jgi:hypothetical protein